MARKILRKIIYGLLSVVTCGCLFVACKNANSTSSSNEYSFEYQLTDKTTSVKLDGDTFDKSVRYYVGDVVKFPSSVEVNGEETSVSAHLVYPSGKKVVVTDVKFDETGLYSIEYKNSTGAVVMQDSFKVYKSIFTTITEKTTYELGKVKNYTDYDSTLEGAIVSLASGDILTYSEIIDLSDNTKSDPLFSLKVLPEEGAEVRTMIFTLTDIYDPENVLTITIVRSNPYPENIMMTVKGPNQKSTGLELWWQDEGFTYDGNFYRVHREDGWGTNLVYDMGGTTGEPFNVSFDYETKRIYLNGSLVADLDDPVLFYSLWNGFSSGKCIFSMYAQNYSRNKFNYLLTNLDGVSTFSEYSSDVEAPELFVKNEGLEDVYLVVGKDFKLPEASSFDIVEGECGVDVNVYKNYGKVTQTRMNVENNTFTPIDEGVYKIVYTAQDRSGNRTIETMDVLVKPADTPLVSIEQNEDGDDSAVVGKEVLVSNYSVNNNNGKYEVSIKAVGQYEECIVDKDSMSFLPLYADTYTIVYTVKDYITTAETFYEIEVGSAGAESILNGEPIIPKYIILNATHKTPTLTGYRFVNGKPVETETELYISETQDLSEATKITEDTFTYSGPVGECWLCYKLDDTLAWYPTTAVNVGAGTNALSIPSYFVGKNDTTVSFAPTNTYTDYTLNGSNGVSTIEFVNALQIFDFSLELVIPETRTYNELTVTFQDIDSTKAQSVFVKMKISETGSLEIYDSERNTTTLNNAVGKNLIIGYEERTGTFSFTCGSTAYLTGIKGAVEFTDSKAYVEISVNAEDSALRICRLNNQLISSAKKDLVFPQYTYASQYGRFDQNEKVQIDGIQISDVLAPFTSVSMSVRTLEGKYLLAEDGTKLDENADYTKDYTIVLSEVTYYYVLYSISDGNNQTTYRYTFVVSDTQKPEVEIGSHKTQYKVGETVVVGDCAIRDNVSKSEDCVMYITVTMPTNKTITLRGNSFVANIAGKYSVYYYVEDEAGNATLYSYDITVS